MTVALNTNVLYPRLSPSPVMRIGVDRITEAKGLNKTGLPGRLPCWNVTQYRMVTNGDKIDVVGLVG